MKIVEIEVKADSKEKFAGMYVFKVPAGTTFVKCIERDRKIVLIGLFDEKADAELLINKPRTIGVTLADRVVPEYMQYIDSVLIQSTHLWHVFQRVEPQKFNLLQPLKH